MVLLKKLIITLIAFNSLEAAASQSGFYRNQEALKFRPKDRTHCGQSCHYSQALMSFAQSFHYQKSLRTKLSSAYEKSMYDHDDSALADQFIETSKNLIGPFCEALDSYLPREGGWLPSEVSSESEVPKPSSDNTSEFLDKAYCYEQYLVYHQAYTSEIRRSVVQTTKSRIELDSKNDGKRSSLIITENDLYSSSKKPQVPLVQTKETVRKSIRDSKQEVDQSKRLDLYASEQFASLQKPRVFTEADFILFEKDPSDPTQKRLKTSCGDVIGCVCRVEAGYCFDAARLKRENLLQKNRKEAYEKQLAAIQKYGENKNNQLRDTISDNPNQDGELVKVFDESSQYIVYQVNSEIQNLVQQVFPGKQKGKKDSKRAKNEKDQMASKETSESPDKSEEMDPKLLAARAALPNANVDVEDKARRMTPEQILAHKMKEACGGKPCTEVLDGKPGARGVSATVSVQTLDSENDEVSNLIPRYTRVINPESP